MRNFIIHLVCFLFICNFAIGKDVDTNNATSGIKVTNLGTTDPSTGLYQIIVQFTNFVYKGSSNLVSEDIALNTNYYTLIQTNDNTTNSIVLIKASGNEPVIGGTQYCPGVNLEGNFSPSKNYSLIIQYPDVSPIPISLSPSGSNTLWSAIFGPVNFSITPYNANGSGGFGLQYNFNLNFNAFESFNKKELFNTNNPVFLKADLTSQGVFGLNYGSNNSSSNNIQDSLTAEADFKALYNWRIPNYFDPANKVNIYPVGLLVSPVGFEWNKEFTMGNYTPKIALGGSTPYIDWPAIAWSKWLGLTNSFTSPTLFSGITYVDSIATNGLADSAASSVHERWDSEYIYDMPLLSIPAIKLDEVAFRFTWNSYVGIDHSLWANYYQLGTVWYFQGSNKAGVFVGYASGEQPPAYKKTDGWQLGFSLKF